MSSPSPTKISKSVSGSRIRTRVHYQKGALAKSVEELRSMRAGISKEDIREPIEASGLSTPQVDPKKYEDGPLFPSCDDLCASLGFAQSQQNHGSWDEAHSSKPHNNSPMNSSPSDLDSRVPKEFDLLAENFVALKRGLVERFRQSEKMYGSPRCCDNCKKVEVLVRCKSNLLIHYLCLGCIEKIMGVKPKDDHSQGQ